MVAMLRQLEEKSMTNVQRKAWILIYKTNDANDNLHTARE
jgi:hypothetical protein